MCRAKGPHYRRCKYHQNEAVMASASAKQSVRRLGLRLEKLESDGATDSKLQRVVNRWCAAHERLSMREQVAIPDWNQEKGETSGSGDAVPLRPAGVSAADSLTAATIENLSWDDVAVLANDYWDDPEASEKIQVLIEDRERAESEASGSSTGWPDDSPSLGAGDWVSNPTVRPQRKLTPHERAREEYDSYVYAQYAQCESELSFHLNEEGKRRGVDSFSLFSGPVSRVKKYGSEELQSWFARNGRQTLASFRHGLFGWSSDAGAARRVRLEGFENVAHVG